MYLSVMPLGVDAECVSTLAAKLLGCGIDAVSRGNSASSLATLLSVLCGVRSLRIIKVDQAVHFGVWQ